MPLPNLTPSWAATGMRNTRTRLLLVGIAAVLVLLWSTFYLFNWRKPPPWKWPPPYPNYYPHTPYRPQKPIPKYPRSNVPWLDTLSLTREVNISAMLASQPGKWDMFLDPIPELLYAPPPRTHRCEDNAEFGPMLFVGVFTIAAEHKQRAVIRALQTLQSPPSEQVVMKFILGRSPDASLQSMAETEAEMYGDIVFLDIQENMNEGKTYVYWKWVSKLPVGQQPRFALKADSDTFLILPNVLHSLAPVPCSLPVYWGTSWGSCIETCYPLYCRGLSYGMSWPLISWLGQADLPQWATEGMEDARTGAWFGNLPQGEESLMLVDLYTHAGDWDGTTITYDTDIVALHAMKNPQLYARVAAAMLQVWETAGREWRWPPEGTEWND
ncbi:hypothetical protein DACRYDRAFT_115252 [Dacryopinax primogenitus]|uniref:Hexosyltransferase n=1 Tax=Dacryopinax primogenitus (strain DJM 731) TaxID=1858805 RepID=M5G2M9_DACPD|nr:uncharacterized protein DACRYDRAFT_115252 [Dacryopinax primogenitus]EJU02949.1 hypothetical protein DACRYDRAFT_115252 [Dacryopinax primogenitus]